MGKLAQILGREDRFGKLIERKDDKDLPFYNGKPVELSVKKWILLWASVLVGFLVLIFFPASNNITSLIPRTLFLLIPLLTIVYVIKEHWKALFHKPTKGDYGAMILFFILNLAVTSLVALLVKALFGANANAAANGLADAGALEIVSFYVGTGIQLMGEEIFTIIPFLAIMYFFYSRGKVTRKQAIIWALILSAVWFSLAHLPTYGWNLLQVLLVIGTARIVLTLAYIRTKNLWVSFGAHLLNDWVIFTFVAFGAIVLGAK